MPVGLLYLRSIWRWRRQRRLVDDVKGSADISYSITVVPFILPTTNILAPSLENARCPLERFLCPRPRSENGIDKGSAVDDIKGGVQGVLVYVVSSHPAYLRTSWCRYLKMRCPLERCPAIETGEGIDKGGWWRRQREWTARTRITASPAPAYHEHLGTVV